MMKTRVQLFFLEGRYAMGGGMWFPGDFGNISPTEFRPSEGSADPFTNPWFAGGIHTCFIGVPKRREGARFGATTQEDFISPPEELHPAPRLSIALAHHEI